jgi:DNA-binding response OmpR family regulator
MNVLFAADDPAVRELLSGVLARLGHETIVVTDGAEAWRLYGLHRPTLVVLDIDTRGHSGLELCRLVREHDPQRETFILVLTERHTEDDLRAVLDAGADDYMTKPASPENLFARLSIAERRIEQDRARRTAEVELQRARFLAGIGETTITLQHEINNPLSALLGHTELMLMDLRASGASTEQLEIIYEQGRRIAAVVRRLAELREPKSVDYVAGAKMIDLPQREDE